jgi:type II secretory pathway component PulF
MRSSPGRDEREAYLLTDVASAHEAGLSTAQILSGPATATLASGDPVALDSPLAEGLQHKGVRLAPHELLILQAAERAGDLARALRTLADRRNSRAALHRELRRKLAYPLFLLGFGFVVSLISCVATKTSMWTPVLILASLVAAVWLTTRYALAAVDRTDSRRVPLVTPLVEDLGELPYLHAFHGLYSAGVPIVEAHAEALKTSPIPGVRLRLFQASQAIGEGQGYADALQKAGALHSETRQMLSSAEVSGDLENTLERAIQRRQDSLERKSRILAKIAVATITVLVYGFVAYVIFSFYLGMYSSILNR